MTRYHGATSPTKTWLFLRRKRTATTSRTLVTQISKTSPPLAKQISQNIELDKTRGRFEVMRLSPQRSRIHKLMMAISALVGTPLNGKSPFLPPPCKRSVKALHRSLTALVQCRSWQRRHRTTCALGRLSHNR